MPIIGETGSGSAIGYKTSTKHIWHACVYCGKERWVQIVKGEAKWQRCLACADMMNNGGKFREKNANWKGGRHIDGDGYVKVILDGDDFCLPMANQRHYILEHRLVMARYLERCLENWEFIHHLNGIRDDNRIENLQLTTNRSHISNHINGYRDGYKQGYQDARREYIKKLEEGL